MKVSTILTLTLCLAVVCHGAQTPPLQDKSSPYTLYKIDTATGARCLDGSAPAFYFKNGTRTDAFMIYFEGGGWCGDQTYDLTLASCYSRSHGNLGSSKSYPQTVEYHGILSRDSATNPEFYDWPTIFLKYCDGTGYNGYVETPYMYNGQEVYFRGRLNAEETIRYALKNLGLAKASRVLVSGGSAGGLATITWASWINKTVTAQNPDAKVFAAPDSGIFFDAVNVVQGDHNYRIRIQNFMEIANLYDNPPNAACVKEYPGEKWKCLFAQYSLRFVDVPTFIIQSPQDSWCIPNILGVKCLTSDGALNFCTQQQMTAITDFRDQMLKVITGMLAERPTWGAWSPACSQHVYSGGDSRFNGTNFQVPMYSGNTLANTLSAWLDGKTAIQIDYAKWPANIPCSGLNGP